MKRKTPTQTEADLVAARLLIADLERENGITRAALNLSRERAEDAESDLSEMTDRANAAELELNAIRAKEAKDQADLDAFMDEESAKAEAGDEAAADAAKVGKNHFAQSRHEATTDELDAEGEPSGAPVNTSYSERLAQEAVATKLIKQFGWPRAFVEAGPDDRPF